MITDEVLYARALTYVCEQHKINPQALKQWDGQRQVALQDYAQSLVDDMRYDQLKYFRPFEHQKKFFKTGVTASRRGLIAANRTGKTVATCYELAMHLTGLYPSWWEGRRWDKPISAFVAGESWDQVARVLQEELIGTSDSKLVHAIGTGAIPRSKIVMDTMRNDGANVMSIEVRHVSGQHSRLLFGNYTQEVRNMQGFKMDIVVFDEHPPDDMFSELVTRTATLQGQIFCSFTPLKGTTGLVSRFLEHEIGYEYVQVGWDDLPEYSPWGEPFLLKSTREQMLVDYMPHEREARTKGSPVMGLGAIFPIRDWPTYISGTYNFDIMPNIERIIALDLGMVRDKTVISLMYWDPRTREAWLDKQLVISAIKDKANRVDRVLADEGNPTGYIQHLLLPEVFGCPIVLPADANTPGRYTMASSSIRDLFESYGLNVYDKPIMNPPDSEGKTTNNKSFGVNMMRQMLEFGTLHINANCQSFLSEAQNYSIDEKGRYSDPDDCIDSARYALLGCLNDICEPYDGLAPQQRMAQARIMLDETARARKQNKPVWKQPMDPNSSY